MFTIIMKGIKYFSAFSYIFKETVREFILLLLFAHNFFVLSEDSDSDYFISGGNVQIMSNASVHEKHMNASSTIPFFYHKII